MKDDGNAKFDILLSMANDSRLPEKLFHAVKFEADRLGVPFLDYVDCFVDQLKLAFGKPGEEMIEWLDGSLSSDGDRIVDWLDLPTFERWRKDRQATLLPANTCRGTSPVDAEAVWVGEELIGFRCLSCQCPKCLLWNARIDAMQDAAQASFFSEKSGRQIAGGESSKIEAFSVAVLTAALYLGSAVGMLAISVYAGRFVACRLGWM